MGFSWLINTSGVLNVSISGQAATQNNTVQLNHIPQYPKMTVWQFVVNKDLRLIRRKKAEENVSFTQAFII